MTEEEIARLEARGQAWADAAVLAALAAVAVQVAALTASAARAVVVRVLVGVDWLGFERVLLRVARQGYASGVEGRLVSADALPDVDVPLELVGHARTATDTLRAAVADVVDAARSGADPVALGDGLRRAGTRAGMAVDYTAARSVNEGVVEAARAAGRRMIWRAERTACLACLSYSGAVAAPGDVFRPLIPGMDIRLPLVQTPPRHPRCRCTLAPYAGPVASSRSTPDVASGLAREARRSIALGRSGYASNPALVRAAERLLRLGADLPASVTARSAAAIRRGTFTS